MQNVDLLALIDQYSPIIRDEFLDAVFEMQNSIEGFILENYPVDTSDLSPESSIDEIVLNALETQLLKGFQDNLAALYDESQAPVILLLSIPKINLIQPKYEFIKSEIKTIAAESKKATQIAGTSKTRIFETLGLTPNQARSLIHYRQALENIANGKTQSEILDIKIIRNLSASQRSAVRHALSKGIEQQDVDYLVSKQQKALLINRAKAIGNSLASKTAHIAQQTVIDSAISLNLVKPDQFKRFWITAHDEKVRHAHNQTEALNAAGVELNQPFKTPFGAVMYPPLEINCRCHVVVRKINTNGF